MLWKYYNLGPSTIQHILHTSVDLKVCPKPSGAHYIYIYIYIIIIIIKSLFPAMPIKVRCTIAQKSAQIVGARVHVCIITKLRKHTGVAKRSTYININIQTNDSIWHISV